MRQGAIRNNSFLPVGPEHARRRISLKASITTRFSCVLALRAIGSAGRTAWSFWLDETCNVPDRERYGSKSPSISNFSQRQAERSVAQALFVLWRE